MLIRINGKLAKLKSIFYPATDAKIIHATFQFTDLLTETFVVKSTSALFLVLKFAFEHHIPSSTHTFNNIIEY